MPADKHRREELGRRIRHLRLAQHLTIQQLAISAEMGAGYLSEVERGLAAVSSEKLVRISESLGVKAGALLEPNAEPSEERASVTIPAALSAAAEQLGLSHRATVMLLDAQRCLTRGSESEGREWGIAEWTHFYNQVREYLPRR